MNQILESLLKIVKNEFEKIEDFRQSSKIRYKFSEVLLDNLLLYVQQYPSFRQFKQSYASARGIARVGRINISSTQQKAIIDNINPFAFRSIYKRLFKVLQRSKILEKYTYHDNSYLILLDGSGYHSSKKIKCSSCLTRQRDGGINYQHQVLQMFLVHPVQEAIIALMPEEISNTDGKAKQDCEINAAKRALKLLKSDHPKLKMILVGDGLYSKQLLIEEVLRLGMKFIFVVKPGDHKSMFEDISGIRVLGDIESYVVNENGIRHYYEWVNNIPLNGNQDSQSVNYFSYECSKAEKIMYKNSWVTSFVVSKNNVRKLSIGGRARWSCENQGFNCLKNQGYHIDHNYGHGKRHLAFNNYLLNLLSFFLHKFCELKDKLFKKCCTKLGNKALIWQKVRDYTEIKECNSFDEVFALIAGLGAIYGGIPPPITA